MHSHGETTMLALLTHPHVDPNVADLKVALLVAVQLCYLPMVGLLIHSGSAACSSSTLAAGIRNCDDHIGDIILFDKLAQDERVRITTAADHAIKEARRISAEMQCAPRSGAGEQTRRRLGHELEQLAASVEMDEL